MKSVVNSKIDRLKKQSLLRNNVSVANPNDERQSRIFKDKKDSIKIIAKDIKFVITDFKNDINVVYSGAIPNLFQEGKGVVAEGYLKDRNFFLATKILAKHDENYMPPEVKEALEGK